MNKVFYLLILLSPLAISCEITKEYGEIREELAMDLQEPFLSCTGSVSNYYYWKEVSQCVEEGLGENIGGGCQHIVAYRTATIDQSEYEHCEKFKISNKEIREYIELYVKTHNITKCSPSQSPIAEDQ